MPTASGLGGPGDQPVDFPFGPPRTIELDPAFAALRERQPVVRIRLPYGGEGWLVLRYADNLALLADRRFSRARAVGEDVPRTVVMPPGGSSLTLLDPPEHGRLRGYAVRALGSRRVLELGPRIAEIAGELLDALIHRGPPADLVAEFTLALPMRVICELLGVPYADRERFSTAAGIFLSSTAYRREEVEQAVEELSDYLWDLVEQRRAHPGEEDFIGVLVQAQEDGDRLDDDEVLTLLATLLAAGFENVANAIGSYAYLLMARPDLATELRRHPDRIPAAVEEFLRLVPVTVGVTHARIATEDLVVAGTAVRRGDAVFASLPSANRDPAVFAEPDEVRLDRTGTRHLAFGHGPHHCIGAALARSELTVALRSLLTALPGLRLDEDRPVVWRSGLTVRGPAELPVRW
ncbi:MAG: cytochrome P450 [Actinobacteria bacterium]|nr:cytochrome P450 [Actinomycetota bacterium]